MTSICDNGFKLALRQSQKPLFGLFSALASPYCAEVAATAGFDWLLIDGEHGPNDVRSVLWQLQAVAPYSVEPIVRAPMAQAWYLKMLLDVGAKSILVPMVETAEQAVDIVSATRYPPVGKRGVGATLARASRWNLDPQFLNNANESICVLVQVETQLGVTNIEEIAAVQGIDGIFVGPSDLSADMGLIGQVSHPDVKAVVEDACQRILNAGLAPGTFASDENSARRAVEIGCHFVAVGSDASILARGTRELAERAKRWGDDRRHSLRQSWEGDETSLSHILEDHSDEKRT